MDISSTLLMSERLILIMSQLTPNLIISSLVFKALFLSLKYVNKISLDSSANPKDIAFPIPFDPPVIRDNLFLNLFITN